MPPRRKVDKDENKRAGRARVRTNAGLLVRRGVNEWGKTIVVCPRCGGRATTGRTLDVWCKDCGFSTAGLSGCG